MNLIPWRRKQEGNIVSSQPDNTLARLRDETEALFERLFHDPWFWPEGGTPGLLRSFARPRTDLEDAEDAVTVRMELPGVDPRDVDIRVASGLLTVRGEKKAETERQRGNYQCLERRFGAFQRTVQLPSTVDPDKVDASYKNGVLTITLAKHPDAKPKRITVRNA